jgi:hypothetical protein
VLSRRARSDHTARATTIPGGNAYKFMVANAVFVAEKEVFGCVGVLSFGLAVQRQERHVASYAVP